AALRLFADYEHLSGEVLELLRAVTPRPAEMGEAAYTRALRARAFDVARSLLPLATHTSVGQVVSARVLERQISRLLSDPYDEVRSLGEELRAACLAPAEVPLWRKALRQHGLPEDALGELASIQAAPTLVKYAQPNAFAEQTQ